MKVLALVLPSWSLRAKVALLVVLYVVIIVPPLAWPWWISLAKAGALIVLYIVCVPRLLAHVSRPAQKGTDDPK